VSEQGSDSRAHRRIRFSFSDLGVSAVADLLDDDCPDTCQVLWDLLPLRIPAFHDVWSGHLVLAHLDNTVLVKPENVLTHLPMPGDIFYYYRPPHYVRGAPYGRSESAEIGIVYARDTRPQGPRGPEAVNLFATMSSGLDVFADACEKMIRDGQRELLIERVE
jgi:hypothetical protein